MFEVLSQSRVILILFHSCVTITTRTTLRVIKCFHHLKYALLVACNNHLGNAFTVIDDEIRVGKVHEQHHEFTAVVGIYRSRSVENRDAMLQSKSAARANLCLPYRKRYI